MAYTSSITRDGKARSAPALGGIGAGFFELHTDGICRNWNVANNVPQGTGAPFPMRDDSMLFFIVRYEVEGQYPQMRILQVAEGYHVGNIENYLYAFPWLSGVDRVEQRAGFPFIEMSFHDDEMPLAVELEAFSPFIPHDVKNSALPTAVFRFRLRSRAKKPVHVMLMASMHNCVGYDVERKHHVTRVRRRKGYKLFELTEAGMDTAQSSYGSLALASLDPASTHYVGWEAEHPYYEYVIRHRELPNFDDTPARNWKDPETGELIARWGCFGTIAASRRLARGGELEHTFVAGWHFPSLYSQDGAHRPGHYYANHFDSADEVCRYVIRNLDDLRGRSRRFARDFRDSSAPEFVLDQVNSQLNTFFTSSWLSEQMEFGILEGLRPDKCFGPLATIDVSMYGAMSVAALFPELHQNMMRLHRSLQLPNGEVQHGLAKDFTRFDAEEGVTSRLDMPSQYVMLALLGYFWTGDRAYLEEMWPSCKLALEYVLTCRDHNGDCLPDMEGVMCSYDNFAMWGVSSYVSSLWLGALVYAVEAARRLGDKEAEARYAGVLDRAKESFEDALWTGDYYRLFNDRDGGHGADDGCMTDQLIGQWAAHLAGLGHILPAARVRKALRTICRISRQPWGLVNCRWPDDEFLHPVPEECWHDQANTPWTGVELAFASFLLFEGLGGQALGVVQNVECRYRKAGMCWDHIEFGGHYYRPMSAWAIVNGLLGLTINDGAYGFAPRVSGAEVRLFFSFGAGTAHYERRIESERERIWVEVQTGAWRPKSLSLALAREGGGKATVTAGGERLGADRCEAQFAEGELRLEFPRPLNLAAGERLVVSVR